jgi:hypothetical protein
MLRVMGWLPCLPAWPPLPEPHCQQLAPCNCSPNPVLATSHRSQAAQQAQAGGSPWQVHYTAEGRPYFFNAQTGVTQWTAPA